MAQHSVLESSKTINDEADHDTGKWTEAGGLKFKPTDEVLAGYYLSQKVSGHTDGPIFPLIKEINVYQHEPEKLESIGHKFNDGNMYFYSVAQRKFKNGSKNIARKAEGGSWWPGKSSDVFRFNKDKQPIARKRSLKYLRKDPKSGKPKIKTQWLMKEFTLLDQGLNDEEHITTLCVIKRKQWVTDNEEAGCSSAAAQTETKDFNDLPNDPDLLVPTVPPPDVTATADSNAIHIPNVLLSQLGNTVNTNYPVDSSPDATATADSNMFDIQFSDQLDLKNYLTYEFTHGQLINDIFPQAIGNTISTNPALVCPDTTATADSNAFHIPNVLPSQLGNTINTNYPVHSSPDATATDDLDFSIEEFIYDLYNPLGNTIISTNLALICPDATAAVDSNVLHQFSDPGFFSTGEVTYRQYNITNPHPQALGNTISTNPVDLLVQTLPPTDATATADSNAVHIPYSDELDRL